MSSEEILTLAFMFVAVIAWTAVGWLRVYQLTQASHIEDFNGQLQRNAAVDDQEARACALTVLCTCALVLVWGIFIAAQSSGLEAQLSTRLLAATQCVLAVLAIRLRPRNSGVTPTRFPVGRMIRLITLTVVIDAIPALFLVFCLLVGLYITFDFVPFSDSWSYRYVNWVGLALWTTWAELPAFVFAPYALKFASVLLRPVEKIFAHTFP